MTLNMLGRPDPRKCVKRDRVDSGRGTGKPPRPGDSFRIWLTQHGSPYLDGLVVNSRATMFSRRSHARAGAVRGANGRGRALSTEKPSARWARTPGRSPFVVAIDVSLPPDAKASFESQQQQIRWLVRVVLTRRGRTVERSFRLAIGA